MESFNTAFRVGADQQSQDHVPQSDNLANVPFDVEFPTITLRTVDYAVKKWFTDDQPIFIHNNLNYARKVPIIWSTEERWTMMQKNPDVRDVKGQLILP